MKKRITKAVAVISAISVVLGILLCAVGAEQNGSLRRFKYFKYSEPDRDYLYPNGRNDLYDFFDDFFDDDIDGFYDDFYDDFNIYGGGNNETSL